MTDTEDKSTKAITISENTVVSFHYKMYDVGPNGEAQNCLEDSYSGEPIYYLHGFKNIIPGLESAMTGKAVGEKFAVSLDPISAYGPRQSDAVRRVPQKHLQFSTQPKKLKAGMVASVKTEKGMRNVVILKAGKFNVDVDFNHPLAGKDLHYELEIVSARPATAEEITHRHVHGTGGHHH